VIADKKIPILTFRFAQAVRFQVHHTTNVDHSFERHDLVEGRGDEFVREKFSQLGVFRILRTHEMVPVSELIAAVEKTGDIVK